MIFAVSAGMPLHAASSEKKENKTVASEDALPSLALDGLPDVWIQGTPVKEWEKDKVYILNFGLPGVARVWLLCPIWNNCIRHLRIILICRLSELTSWTGNLRNL